jgi:acetolactate synthase-1/2/3 large subunit
VSDYIASYLVEQGITHNFTVPGGGAMHLNVSFGNQQGLKNVFMQHEQAAAMAAEAYARINNKLPLVCCTTGPGGTNTLTGVLGAWLDSIPMLVISGQVKYPSTARYSGLPLRAMGDQEFDIVRVVEPMTKYACMITDVLMVRRHLQEALYIAQHGRPGPVWLDIPLDIQGALVDTDELLDFIPDSATGMTPEASDEQIMKIVELLRSANRPVLNLGNGIRIADAKAELDIALDLLGIPAVTGFNSIDVIETEHPLYVGRAGLIGDRPGNWAVQNSDLLLSIGSRLSARQVGYDVKKWARESFVIMVDIDDAELKKPTIHVELPVHSDVRDFLNKLNKCLQFNPINRKDEWLSVCSEWKHDYPVVGDAHCKRGDAANVYYFMRELSKRLPERQITVTGNGSAYVASSQAYIIRKGQRYISNSGAASMGYDLPAAIGASFAAGKETVICLTGEGSIQMNLQELQTIVFHRLPIKIFVINNQGYHSMRQTQDNLFPDIPHVGIGPETDDLSFPPMMRIAAAYGIPYFSAHSNSEIPRLIDDVLACESCVLAELFVATDQRFEPKSATKRYPDGRLVSPPLEDLAPFLPRQELESIMVIPLLESDA